MAYREMASAFKVRTGGYRAPANFRDESLEQQAARRARETRENEKAQAQWLNARGSRA